MAKDESSSVAPAVGAGLAAAAGSGGGYAMYLRAKKRRAAQAAEEAARQAASASKLRKAKRIKGGKAVAGVAALAAGAEALRRVAKNPKVRKYVGNRRVASAISSGGAKAAKGKDVPSAAARQFSETPGLKFTTARREVGGPAAKTPSRSAASRQRHAQASAANVSKGRMRKTSSQVAFEAFSDECVDIIEKKAGITRVLGGALRAKNVASNPAAFQGGQDALSRAGNWYVDLLNRRAANLAKRKKKGDNMLAALTGAKF